MRSERRHRHDESQDRDGAVEPQEVDPGGPERDHLRVGAEPSEGDQQPEKERDRERQDDDVRQREGEDAKRVAERVLALEHEVGEEDEPRMSMKPV